MSKEPYKGTSKMYGDYFFKWCSNTQKQTIKKDKKANYQQVNIIDENKTECVSLTLTNEKNDVSHRRVCCFSS